MGYTYIPALKSFFKYYDYKKDWVNAVKECAFEGADLWVPETEEEFKNIKSYWQNRVHSNKTYMYLGISDRVIEGKFETIDGKCFKIILLKINTVL